MKYHTTQVELCNLLMKAVKLQFCFAEAVDFLVLLLLIHEQV